MARKNRNLAAKADRAKRERREIVHLATMQEVVRKAIAQTYAKPKVNAEPTRIIYTHW